jgi:hypothetical protein
MRPNTRAILQRAIEEGAAYGVRRAFKYSENPSEDDIAGRVEMAVMDAVDELFCFDSE